MVIFWSDQKLINVALPGIQLLLVVSEEVKAGTSPLEVLMGDTMNSNAQIFVVQATEH